MNLLDNYLSYIKSQTISIKYNVTKYVHKSSSKNVRKIGNSQVMKEVMFQAKH